MGHKIREATVDIMEMLLGFFLLIEIHIFFFFIKMETSKA